MGARTKIEWTASPDGKEGASWNPVRGCTRKSRGCIGCYAEGVAARFSDPGQPYHGFADRNRSGSKWTGRVELIPSALMHPLRWRAPKRIFVNSMSDLFHEALPWMDIAAVFGVSIAAHHLRGHTLLILTKRTGRMARILRSDPFWTQAKAEAGRRVAEFTAPLDRARRDRILAAIDLYGPDHPPPGIWLGGSAEDQASADERIPEVLATPAAVRFMSLEPLLGPIDLFHVGAAEDMGWNAVHGRGGLDWIIVGGQSGPEAQPMHPDWARSLRDQCTAAGVPFFFKQWGEWAPHSPRAGGDLGGDIRAGRVAIVHPSGRDDVAILQESGGTRQTEKGSRYMERVGKRAAGAELDGALCRAMPVEQARSPAP